MMGNVELAPEVDVSTLEPLLSPNVVSGLLDTYMSTLTVSRATVLSQNDLCLVPRHCVGSPSIREPIPVSQSRE